MKTKLFLSILFISVLFNACKKESDIEDLTTPNITTSDSSILKTFIGLDTSLTAIHQDTTDKISYTYDNLMRLISKRQVEYYYNNPTIVDTSLTHTTYYYYNGNDSLVSRILTIDRGGSSPVVDSTLRFFQRNNNLQQIRDSSITFRNYNNGGYSYYIAEVSNFTYNSDSVILTNKAYSTNNSTNFFLQVYKFKQTIVGGNIIKEVRKIFTTGVPPSQLDSSQMFYDNKINPFAIEKINSPVLLKPLGNEAYYQSRNNQTKFIGSPNIFNSVYTYNTLGLPKTVIFTQVGVPINSVKGIFIYSN